MLTWYIKEVPKLPFDEFNAIVRAHPEVWGWQYRNYDHTMEIYAETEIFDTVNTIMGELHGTSFEFIPEFPV